jgi:methanogenic corrinoid protein MtbC1
MHPLYKDFIQYLVSENKSKVLDFILSKLDNKAIDIVTLYNELLRPALNNMECNGPEEYCIWKEHVRSSIIRAVIENCYQFVNREHEEKYGNLNPDKKVMVICPTEELHEIGPRMVTDFFTLCGYSVTFVGANTPKRSFLSAIDIVKPDYIAISVTNYYNLVATQKVISEIRKQKHQEFEIIVGGHAFTSNPDIYKKIGADLLLQSFEDIKKLAGGD